MSLSDSLLRHLLLLASGLILCSCSTLPRWAGEDGVGSIFSQPSGVADTEEDSGGFFRGLFNRDGQQDDSLAAQPSKDFNELAVDGFAIERVKVDQLREVGGVPTTEPSLRFNKRRRLWGAISSIERQERLGQYFVVDWEGPKTAKNQTVTVRFEYRQRETGPQLKVMETNATVSGREQFTEFAVIGEQFREAGIVTAWKITILRGGTPVATRNSFLWN